MVGRGAVVASLLFAFAASSAAAEPVSGVCSDEPRGFLGGLVDDLKTIGFVAGAHVLNVVDHSPAYPEGELAREKANARVAKNVEKLSKKWDEDRLSLLEGLRDLGVDDVDLFHGSHVVVTDGGDRYREWQGLANARARTSSHYPGVTDTQYEIELPGAGVVLFGVTGDGDTWFQTEAHADTSGVQWVLHRLDYVKHKGFGFVNVGPMGLSPHSEKKANEITVTPR